MIFLKNFNSIGEATGATCYSPAVVRVCNDTSSKILEKSTGTPGQKMKVKGTTLDNIYLSTGLSFDNSFDASF